MEHRADIQIHRLQVAEGVIHLVERFVGIDRLFGDQRRFWHGGADDIDIVESGFGGDGVVVAATGEDGVGDGQCKVLAHLALVEHGVDGKSISEASRNGLRLRAMTVDAAQLPLGRRQQVSRLRLRSVASSGLRQMIRRSSG